MEGISSLVAVVPVIAKADTHTAPELDAYRRELLQVRLHFEHNDHRFPDSLAHQDGGKCGMQIQMQVAMCVGDAACRPSRLDCV